MKELLRYDIGDGVEAFSTRKDASLPFHVIQPHQVHSDGIAVITDSTIDRDCLMGVDALVTNLVDCPIGVRTADCVPILVYDCVNRAVAAIHSGWRGTVKRIVQKVIREMNTQYGTCPQDIRTVIGPSIGPESFVVHGDVIEAFIHSGFPIDKMARQNKEDSYLVNLWEANKYLLEEIGVKGDNIQLSGICSYTHHDEFYSARYEHDNKCRRTINVIKLKA